MLLRCTATIGALSNQAHKNIKVRRPLQLGLRQHILPFSWQLVHSPAQLCLAKGLAKGQLAYRARHMNDLTSSSHRVSVPLPLLLCWVAVAVPMTCYVGCE